MNRIVLSILAVIVLAACSSDDSTATSTDPDGIVGTWKLLYTESNNTSLDLNNDGIFSSDLTEEMPCMTDANIIFREDGTGSITNGWAVWSWDGEPYDIECNYSSQDFEYSVSGNTLTTTTSLGPNTFTSDFPMDVDSDLFYMDDWHDNYPDINISGLILDTVWERIE